MNPFYQQSFLRLLDYKPADIEELLNLSAYLKHAKKTGSEQPLMKGKNIALIFEKDSTGPAVPLKWVLTIRAHR